MADRFFMRFPWIRTMRAGIRRMVPPVLPQQLLGLTAGSDRSAGSVTRLLPVLLALACAPSLSWFTFTSPSVQLEPDLLGSTSNNSSDPRGLT